MQICSSREDNINELYWSILKRIEFEQLMKPCREETPWKTPVEPLCSRRDSTLKGLLELWVELFVYINFKINDNELGRRVIFSNSCSVVRTPPPLCNIQRCQNWKTLRDLFFIRSRNNYWVYDTNLFLAHYFSAANSRCLSIVIYFPFRRSVMVWHRRSLLDLTVKPSTGFKEDNKHWWWSTRFKFDLADRTQELFWSRAPAFTNSLQANLKSEEPRGTSYMFSVTNLYYCQNLFKFNINTSALPNQLPLVSDD